MKKRMLRIRSTIIENEDYFKEDESNNDNGESSKYNRRPSASEIGEKLDMIFAGLNGGKKFSNAARMEPLKHYMSPKVLNNNFQTMSSEEIVAHINNIKFRKDALSTKSKFSPNYSENNSHNKDLVNKESVSPSEKNLKSLISSNSPESKFPFSKNIISFPQFFFNNNINNAGFPFQNERKKSFFHNENPSSNNSQRRMSAIESPRIRANIKYEETFKKENIISLIPTSSVPQTPFLKNKITKKLPRINSNIEFKGIRVNSVKAPMSISKNHKKNILSKYKLKVKNS